MMGCLWRKEGGLFGRVVCGGRRVGCLEGLFVGEGGWVVWKGCLWGKEGGLFGRVVCEGFVCEGGVVCGVEEVSLCRGRLCVRVCGCVWMCVSSFL